jgi:hypothetical protein
MKQFDPKHLHYIGALSSAVLMTYAGVGCWGAWGWVVGPGVGITASLSVATASSRIGSITAKGRRALAYVMLAVMLFVGPATVALSLYAPKSPWTAVAWGAAVDVSIVLAGAISGKGFVATNEQVAETFAKPARKKKQEAEILQQEPVSLPQEEKKLARKRVSNDDLLAYLAATPGASQQEVADYFGVTRQAIGPRIKKLYEVKQ